MAEVESWGERKEVGVPWAQWDFGLYSVPQSHQKTREMLSGLTAFLWLLV